MDFWRPLRRRGRAVTRKPRKKVKRRSRLDPDYSIGYENVAFALHLPEPAAGSRGTASARHRSVRSKRIEFSLCRYFIAFLRDDQAAMEREMTQRQAKLEAQGFFEHQEALTLAYHGRLKEAARLSDRAVSLSRQAGLRERAALFEGARAAWSALLGDARGGQRKRCGGLVALPKPGRRLRPCLCAGASGRFRASSQDRSRPGKALPGGYICPVQLPAGAAGTGSPQSGRPSESARNDSKWQLRTTSRFRVQPSTPAPSSELSIRSTCAAWLIPGWAAIARQRPSFRKFWIIRESC